MRVASIETARFIYMMMREGMEVDAPTKRNLRAFMCEADPELNQNLLSALRNDMEVTICTDLEDGDEVKCYCIDTEPTDEELHELYERGQIHSLYDCTGLRFLQSVSKFYSKFLKSWVVVERSALDV